MARNAERNSLLAIGSVTSPIGTEDADSSTENKKMRRILRSSWKNGEWTVFSEHVEDYSADPATVVSMPKQDAGADEMGPKMSARLAKVTRRSRRTQRTEFPAVPPSTQLVSKMKARDSTSRFCPTHYHRGRETSLADEPEGSESYRTYLPVPHRFSSQHARKGDCIRYHTHPRWGYTGGALLFPALNRSHNDELKGSTTDSVRFSDGAAVACGGFFHSFRNSGEYSTSISARHGTHGTSRSHYCPVGRDYVGNNNNVGLVSHHTTDLKSGRIVSTATARGRGIPYFSSGRISICQGVGMETASARPIIASRVMPSFAAQ